MASMAYVNIDHTWPDGTRVMLTVGDDDRGYPDRLAELEARAVSIYRSIVVDVDPEPEAPDDGPRPTIINGP